MSVQMNQYLCYGYLLDYGKAREIMNVKHSEEVAEEILDKYFDSAFEKEIVEVDGCSLILDGMDGEYIFFGKIFYKSKVYEPLQTVSIPKVSSKIKKNIEDQLQKIFGEEVRNDNKPGVILLTHYR